MLIEMPWTEDAQAAQRQEEEQEEEIKATGWWEWISVVDISQLASIKLQLNVYLSINKLSKSISHVRHNSSKHTHAHRICTHTHTYTSGNSLGGQTGRIYHTPRSTNKTKRNVTKTKRCEKRMWEQSRKENIIKAPQLLLNLANFSCLRKTGY